jgi:hypothetical protein
MVASGATSVTLLPLDLRMAAIVMNVAPCRVGGPRLGPGRRDHGACALRSSNCNF